MSKDARRQHFHPLTDSNFAFTCRMRLTRQCWCRTLGRAPSLTERVLPCMTCRLTSSVVYECTMQGVVRHRRNVIPPALLLGPHATINSRRLATPKLPLSWSLSLGAIQTYIRRLRTRYHMYICTTLSVKVKNVYYFMWIAKRILYFRTGRKYNGRLSIIISIKRLLHIRLRVVRDN